LSNRERDERIAFYANHGIGWVARPNHDNAEDGFKRAGRFKKASNMNYGLSLSLKAERHLEALQCQQTGQVSQSNSSTPRSTAYEGQYGMQYQNRDGEEQGAVDGGDEDLEEKALGMAIEEVFAESGGRFRPWAANGKAIRLGEIVLLVDSDTIVPEVSLGLITFGMSVDSEIAGLFEGCCERNGRMSYGGHHPTWVRYACRLKFDKLVH